MKFTREALGNVNLVKSYAPGELRIGERILRGAVCISEVNAAVNPRSRLRKDFLSGETGQVLRRDWV